VNGVEGFLFNGHVKHGTNLILVLSFKVISDTNDLLANETLGLPYFGAHPSIRSSKCNWSKWWFSCAQCSSVL